MKLDIEEIKRRLSNQDKNLELIFSYLDEPIPVFHFHNKTIAPITFLKVT